MLTTAQRKPDTNSHLVLTHTVPSGWRNNRRNGTEGAPDAHRRPRSTAGSRGSVYCLKDGVTFASFHTLDDGFTWRDTGKQRKPKSRGDYDGGGRARPSGPLSLFYFKLSSYTIQDCHQVAAGSSERFQTHVPVRSFSLGYRRRTRYSLDINNIGVQAQNGVKNTGENVELEYLHPDPNHESKAKPPTSNCTSRRTYKKVYIQTINKVKGCSCKWTRLHLFNRQHHVEGGDADVCTHRTTFTPRSQRPIPGGRSCSREDLGIGCLA